MTDTAEARIRASFAAQPMMTTIGAELIEIGEGTVRIAAPIAPAFRQQQGYGHAGLTFTLGDTAAGYAALTAMAPGMEVLTAEIKVNLIAPARGERLIATGKVIKPGRRLVIVTSEVHAEEDGKQTLIALFQGTMVPVTA
jgi:uncharacterized protein (TIGR00369 family)